MKLGRLVKGQVKKDSDGLAFVESKLSINLSGTQAWLGTRDDVNGQYSLDLSKIWVLFLEKDPLVRGTNSAFQYDI